MSLHISLGKSISERTEWSQVSNDANRSTKQEPGRKSRRFSVKEAIDDNGENRFGEMVV